MAVKSPAHPDIQTGSRTIRSYGLTDTSMIASASEPDFSLFRCTSNIADTVLDVIRPVVIGGDVLIVTAIEDLMSVLCMVMTLRPGLTYAERGSVRILVTEPDRPSSRVVQAASMSAQRVQAFFMRPDGVHLSDPRDMRALGAREAISSGAIRIRILDHAQLKRDGRRAPAGGRASIIVGEDFAAVSSAGFSRRDLLDRAVICDRVASEGQAYGARREIAERFWSAGAPCGIEVEQVLAGMIRPVEIETALAAAVRAVTQFDLFRGEDAERQPLRADLVSQALARSYENGFAFVSVPAGAGQQEVQEEIARRLEGNAARMIGGDRRAGWDAHVETATGARWTDERIAAVLAEKAPLALDGSVTPEDGESELMSTFRRLKCRTTHGAGRGVSGFEGFPEIRCERLPLAPTKGQLAACEAAWEELEASRAAALDKASERELDQLRRLALQSAEAALLAWKQGGMNTRVRMVARSTGAQVEADQNSLPMFLGESVDEGPVTDLLGDALAARAFRTVDKMRLTMVSELAQRGGQVLCLVEDDLARHALARRAMETGEVSVTAIVSEIALRKFGVPGKEVTYQRAETPDVAMTMLGGAKISASIIFASASQARELSLPAATQAVVLSFRGTREDLAAGLSSIDGIGKASGGITCYTFDDGLPQAPCRDIQMHPSGLVSEATAQMRASGGDSKDGVADLFADLAARLPQAAGSVPHSSVNVAVVESEEVFSIFVMKGMSMEADQGAVPPRILIVCRDPGTGEEVILRNQVGCADFLAGLEWPPREDPRAGPVMPELRHIDVMGRHLSHLSHWDARPERLVRLLDTLAEFLGVDPEGEFSDLCLVSLELIGARWKEHLEASRGMGKVSQPGLLPALDALRARPIWEIEQIKDEMVQLLDWRIVADASRSKTLHHRLVAVVHGTGEAGLAS